VRVPDRYDRQAKSVLALAQDEAVRLHHGFIGPEHLLLGVMREAASPAARALKSSGLEFVKVRDATASATGRGDEAAAIPEIVLTAEAFKILDLALMEAGRLGAEQVAPAHLLLGLISAPGSAGPILERFHVSTDAIRLRLMQQISDNSAGDADQPR
jgi:ATP-dependent Clp protease ATP-binding subunit ClpC